MKKIFSFLVLLSSFNLTSYAQWDVKLSEVEVIANPIEYPHFKWYPDGHISVVKDNDQYIMFWAEFESHRSIGPSQFVEEQEKLAPSTSVFGERGNFNSWDNGGSWLMSVFRNEGDSFIGFFHAEDHWYPHTSNDIAWKSIGVTYSSDEGQSWGEGRQIITSAKTKPQTPEWGGTGDCCVVWDHFNNRWMCYFQEHTISMAVSSDPLGSPGTWKKYYYGTFSQEGLGGYQSPLPGLENYPGGNPSVHWNNYLNKWVMVWHGWQPADIYISVSDDGVIWDTPKSIITSSQGGKAWYPTIIGETDVEAGQIVKIYYADIAADFSFRTFKAQTVTFLDNNNAEQPIAAIDKPADGSTLNTERIKIQASIKNVTTPIANVVFYANDKLIGSDQSFPYQIEWVPEDNGIYKLEAKFEDEESDEIQSSAVTINVKLDVSVKEELEASLIIQPNPVYDIVTLKKLPPGNKEICVYDINAVKLYQREVTEEQVAIDISQLATGMYVIRVLSDKHSLSRRIIKL